MLHLGDFYRLQIKKKSSSESRASVTKWVVRRRLLASARQPKDFAKPDGKAVNYFSSGFGSSPSFLVSSVFASSAGFCSCLSAVALAEADCCL